MEIEVSDENFEDEVVKKSKKIPVVVDFWAEWCGPCQMLKPIMEKLAKSNSKFILAKANVDSTSKHASKYNVMGIPAVKLFKNGKVVDEFVGALPEEKIKQWLDKNLK